MTLILIVKVIFILTTVIESVRFFYLGILRQDFIGQKMELIMDGVCLDGSGDGRDQIIIMIPSNQSSMLGEALLLE